MISCARATVTSLLFLAATIVATRSAIAEPSANGDAGRGKTNFELNCAICHADHNGAGNAAVTQQGPSLVGVFGRKAASAPEFNYTKALRDSGLTWDDAGLDRFLTNPSAAAPGTTMPIAVPKDGDRADIIAYLKTLKGAAGAPSAAPSSSVSLSSDPGDWHHAAPENKHRIDLAALPKPYATKSVGNGPKEVKPPEGATVSVPDGFTAKRFVTGLSNGRLLRTAPNGDIFVAETAANRLRVLRAADGAEAPAVNEIFAEGLNRPFGIAFYPAKDPQWIYVANNNSVVRIPYKSGDLKATGEAQTIVPKLTDSGGGHSTRDVAFSLDGKRMFISVGSGSNVVDHLSHKTDEEIKQWEAEHGRGACWDGETNRADILVTDPEGSQPLHTFATGIRNGVGIAVDPTTGELWTSTNERDGLGDDLVPDYISHVKEGGYYGWPWYYLGNHEDPRHPGERPDLAGQAIVPDVPVQAHSASLEMTFYTAKEGAAAFPAEYRGDIFAAFHGSWNRNSRTGYKVVRVRMKNGVATGEYDDFLTGFVVDETSVWGRPVGVTVAHDGALLVSEDGNGTIWRVAYGGK